MRSGSSGPRVMSISALDIDIGPHWTTLDHIGPHWTTLDHIGPDTRRDFWARPAADEAGFCEPLALRACGLQASLARRCADSAVASGALSAMGTRCRTLLRRFPLTTTSTTTYPFRYDRHPPPPTNLRGKAWKRQLPVQVLLKSKMRQRRQEPRTEESRFKVGKREKDRKCEKKRNCKEETWP